MYSLFSLLNVEAIKEHENKNKNVNVLNIQSIVQQNAKLVVITLYYISGYNSLFFQRHILQREKNERENQSRVLKMKYLSAQAYH